MQRFYFWILVFSLIIGSAGAAVANSDHKPPGVPRLATDLDARYYPYIDRPNYPQRLLAKLNALRSQYGLKPLRISKSLADVAQAHATDMYLRNYVDHVNPEHEDHMGRISRMKPRMIVLQARENLAWYEATFLPSETELIDKQFDGLMNSPPHREAILSDDVYDVGFGFVTYWNDDRYEANQVQLFGDIAGEWVTDLPTTVRPGDVFQVRLMKPMDMFLASNENPKVSFPDPLDHTRLWVGGLPLPIELGRPMPEVKFPTIADGVYTLQCSPKGKNRFVAYRKVYIAQTR